MRRIWSEYIFPVSTAMFMLVLNFVAVLAPLMFAVGVIAATDRCGVHYGMLDKLARHGSSALATVSYVNEDYGYASMHFTNSAGVNRAGELYFQYYGPEVKAALQPGAQARIRYVDSLKDGTSRVILEGQEAAVRNYVCLTPDIWGILLAAWLVVMIKPQIAFVGFVNGEKLAEDAIGLSIVKLGGNINRGKS